MGEVADMMFDGTLCQMCGVFIEEGQADGYPRSCSDCKGDEPKVVKAKKPKTDAQRAAAARKRKRRRARAREAARAEKEQG